MHDRERLNGLLADGPPADGLVLALRPREAARALGISQRKLWDMSQPRGSIPTVRLGSGVVIYPKVLLESWLAEQAAKGGTE
jgi:hypothetical protein